MVTDFRVVGPGAWQTMTVVSLSVDGLRDYSLSLLSRIAQCRVGQRPGSIELRGLKRRRHGYPLMKEPRSDFKAKVQPPK